MSHESSHPYSGRRVWLVAFAVTLGLGAPVFANVITYQETIEDLADPFVFVDYFRNLERTRDLGDGSAPVVETHDATIESENSVSPSFGRWGRDPITFSHIFVPVGPVYQYQLASLEITAVSVSGTPSPGPPPDFFEFWFGLGTPDDPVFIDGNPVGFLNPANPFVEVTWDFSTGDSALIGLLLTDNRIDVTVIPMGPGFIGEPDQPSEPDADKIALHSSTLKVTYSVPEPTSLAIFLAAGAAAFLARKRSV